VHLSKESRVKLDSLESQETKEIPVMLEIPVTLEIKVLKVKLEALAHPVTLAKMELLAGTEILEPREKKEIWEPQANLEMMVMQDNLVLPVFPEKRDLRDRRVMAARRENPEMKASPGYPAPKEPQEKRDKRENQEQKAQMVKTVIPVRMAKMGKKAALEPRENLVILV
jgi:hypothetical protein